MTNLIVEAQLSHQHLFDLSSLTKKSNTKRPTSNFVCKCQLKNVDLWPPKM